MLATAQKHERATSGSLIGRIKAISALALGIISHTAIACECTAWPDGTLENLARSGAVFSGVVKESAWDESTQTFRTTVEVEHTWKGPPARTATVSSRGGKACGFAFQKGEKYLIFTQSGDPARVESCGKTRLLRNAGTELQDLSEYEEWFRCRTPSDCRIIDGGECRAIAINGRFAAIYSRKAGQISCDKNITAEEVRRHSVPDCARGRCALRTK